MGQQCSRASEERTRRAAALRPELAARVRRLGVMEVARRSDSNHETIRRFLRNPSRVPVSGTLDCWEEWLERDPAPAREAYHDWLPTPANIAALAPAVRVYVEDLQHERDPERLHAEVVCRRQQVTELLMVIQRMREAAARPKWFRRRVGQIRAHWPETAVRPGERK